MPNILTPEMGGSGGYTQPYYTDASYDYKYPRELDLKPGSELHEKLKNEILRRARASHTVMKDRFPSWNKIDEALTVYIPLSKEEKDRQDKDSRRPVSVVVPLTYVILETLLTYMVAAFLERPIFRYEGVGSEDVLGSILMEKVIDLHCYKSKVGLALHTAWRDGLTYGLGIVSPRWEIRKGRRTVKEPIVEWSDLAGDYVTTGFEKKTENVTSYEGNGLFTIDPYMYLPDPNVAVQDIQRGEFVGWGRRDNYPSLFSDELDPKNKLFNVQYLKHMHTCKSSIFITEESARDKFGETLPRDDQATKPVDVIYMNWNLIPSDFGIGDSDEPEKWQFALAADNVIIAANPLKENHDMFPLAVCAPDYDGYSVTPLSRLEAVYGEQHTLNWLRNSRRTGVDKVIGNRVVYDPSVLNPYDVESDDPNQPIRARRAAFGKNIKDAIEQLPVHDVTAGHIVDGEHCMNMAMRASGAVDMIQGIMRSGGERRSAAEATGTRQSALSRLEKMAKIMGMQQLQDIGYMFASNVQQFMDDDLYIKTTGRWEEVLRNEYGITDPRHPVKPMDLLINYDVVAHDASIPMSENAATMVQLLQVLLQSPELAQEWDVGRVLQSALRRMGEKNVYEFKRKQRPVQAEVQPTEQVMDQVQRGNMVPFEGGR